jgi:ubiquinone/menaquinone biosynthesis C-methylase UbiE
MSNSNSGRTYTMGRSKEETERLIQQSGLYEDITRRLLGEAGLFTGMKVLDIGSGAGDVAFAAAELVGSEGEVLGVDMNPEILETARARAQAAGLANVQFVAGDAQTLGLPNDFDALIGRLVLMYLPTLCLWRRSPTIFRAWRWQRLLSKI